MPHDEGTLAMLVPNMETSLFKPLFVNASISLLFGSLDSFTSINIVPSPGLVSFVSLPPYAAVIITL